MTKKDTDTEPIKYIYDEMEPTERLEFERRMASDADLLIEVESIKATRERLLKMPVVHPPQYVVDSVIRQSSDQLNGGFSLTYALMAAMILITVSAGYMVMDSEDRSASSGTSEGYGVTLGGAGTSATGLGQAQPWVDYNEVLYIDQGSGSSMTPDSMVNRMQPILKPVPRGLQDRFFQSNVVLTGKAN